jgi:hypothetical protein
MPSPNGSTHDAPPPDRLLLRLDRGGRASVLVLTQPTAATRARLRRFCRNVIETPSFPQLGGEWAQR